MKNIEYKITEDALQALFQGQKVIFDTHGLPRVTLYPPRYGVFVTHEKYQEIVRRAKMEGFEYVIEMIGALGEHKPKTNQLRMRVGELLRLYRNIENMGIRDFAAELGVSPATLSRIERGLPMTGDTLAKIIRWLTS